MSESALPIRFLERAMASSRYLRGLFESGACTAGSVNIGHGVRREEIQQSLRPPFDDEAALFRRLRKLRQSVMARVICRDICEMADLGEVVHTMTVLAEETLLSTLTFFQAQLRAVYGDPRTLAGDIQQLHVVAMGKLGGGELNASSDIDLILTYPEDGETDGPKKIDCQEYFTRLSRKIIAAMATFTEDGFVFRVDTRLRPYGDSGPLVVSFDMLEQYFYTQGREWERYAWVKARVITGDRGDELLGLALPFVYRRHLDYSAMESLRNLHQQIRSEVRRRDAGDDIKLGPGGIREIEFVVQVFQLIRGGRDNQLRTRATLSALTLLAQRGQIDRVAEKQLRDAYTFLRRLEHRLQYLDDKQTQRLPDNDQDRQVIAEAMGFAETIDFEQALEAHRSNVENQFDAIFAEARDSSASPSFDIWMSQASNDTRAEHLGGLGFADPEAVMLRLDNFRQSSRFTRMAASGQARLERLMPALIGAAAREQHADVTFERMLGVIESIGRRESYLALLLEYPRALATVARLASASPWAAEYLARHPILLDELIAPQASELPDWRQLHEALRTELQAATDNPELQMDLLRNFKHAQTFRLLALDLAGRITLESLSDHLSDLATLLLDHTLTHVWAGLRQRHLDRPGFAIIGYGKLGGKELGYASDLDIIFLYDDADERAGETYARLAQRINTWLTSTTSAGVLYETDLRLRPNGTAGLLVSDVDAFREYQCSQAWVWEHQALTRARAVCGDPDICRAFEQTRIEVLSQARELAPLRDEVAAMRTKMRDGHPNNSELFDLKHDSGGIVDVEFIVQYLVLGYAARHRELTENIGNLALLRLAASLGLIPADLANKVEAAYREFRSRQHAIRLQGQRYARLPVEEVNDHANAVRALSDWVFIEKNA